MQLFLKKIVRIILRSHIFRNLITNKKFWLILSHRRGQITKSEEFGRWLSFLCSLDDTQSVVEIGTWSGQGSSKLIAKAMSNKQNEKNFAIGIESNLFFFKMALKNLEKYPRFQVIHGRIIEPSDMDSNHLSPEEEVWFEEDLQDLSTSPLVLGQVPASIDLLLLDGGLFTTWGEYLVLIDRVKGWILLDDISCRKNERVYEDLLTRKEFSLVWKTSVREGSAVFRYNQARVKLSNSS